MENGGSCDSAATATEFESEEDGFIIWTMRGNLSALHATSRGWVSKKMLHFIPTMIGYIELGSLHENQVEKLVKKACSKVVV